MENNLHEYTGNQLDRLEWRELKPTVSLYPMDTYFDTSDNSNQLTIPISVLVNNTNTVTGCIAVIDYDSYYFDLPTLDELSLGNYWELEDGSKHDININIANGDNPNYGTTSHADKSVAISLGLYNDIYPGNKSGSLFTINFVRKDRRASDTSIVLRLLYLRGTINDEYDFPDKINNVTYITCYPYPCA